MRNLIERLLRPDTEPRMLDHVPVGDPALSDSHRQKLQRAAERYGKTFRCAAPDQQREVMVSPGVIGTAPACGSASRKSSLSPGDVEYGSWSWPDYEGNVARFASGARRSR